MMEPQSGPVAMMSYQEIQILIDVQGKVRQTQLSSVKTKWTFQGARRDGSCVRPELTLKEKALPLKKKK